MTPWVNETANERGRPHRLGQVCVIARAGHVPRGLRRRDRQAAEADVVGGDRVEAAFRNLKTDLSIRPIYHHKENRGDAHVLFAVLAYALAITIQLRYRQHGGDLTTPALLETLQGVQLAELSYQTSDGSRLCFERASVPSAAQQAILAALGWPIPERYLPPNLEAEPRRVV